MVGGACAHPIHALELFKRRYDIEYGRAADALRMIQCQTVGYPRASIMSGDVELLEAECAHYLDQIQCHRPLGVGQMVMVAAGLAAGAITAKVWRDDREVFCQLGRHLVPHYVGLRVAMDEHERSAIAASRYRLFGSGGFDAFSSISFERSFLHPAFLRTDRCLAEDWSRLA